jgi:hypothetical protein
MTAMVVGGVVGDEEGFAQQVLAGAPEEGLREVCAGLQDEGLELFAVMPHLFDGAVPCLGRWRLFLLRPVAVRPLHGVISTGGWRGEVEDVVLGDANVFEELPGGVGKAVGDGAAETGGEALDGVVEGGVGLAAVEEGDELGAECLRFRFGDRWGSSWHGGEMRQEGGSLRE